MTDDKKKWSESIYYESFIMFVFTEFVMLQVEVIISLQICVVVFGFVSTFPFSSP